MIKGMHPFVPSDVCLSCDGCCRFKEADSNLRPKITDDEIRRMGKPDLLSEIYRKEKIDSSGYIKTAPCKGAGDHFCSFFAPETNACTVYNVRPFECQLYPFVLIKKDGQAAVAAHHHCPYVQAKRESPEFKEYVVYLEQFFLQEDVAEFIKKNPRLVGDYPEYQDELEYLFTLP